MTANDNKSYLDCFNKLVDKCNNSYHLSIGKRSINADYSAFTEEIETILNHLNIKLVTESELQSIKSFLAKVTLKIGQNKH